MGIPRGEGVGAQGMPGGVLGGTLKEQTSAALPVVARKPAGVESVTPQTVVKRPDGGKPGFSEAAAVVSPIRMADQHTEDPHSEAPSVMNPKGIGNPGDIFQIVTSDKDATTPSSAPATSPIPLPADHAVDSYYPIADLTEAGTATTQTPIEGDQPADSPFAEREARESQERERIIDRHPEWRNVTLEVYLGPHVKAEDKKELSDLMQDAAIFLHENMAGDHFVSYYQEVANMKPGTPGYLPIEELIDTTEIDGRPIRGTAFEPELRAIHASGAIVGHIDLRAGDEISADDIERLDSRSFSTDGREFEDYLQALEQFLRPAAEIEEKREQIMTSRFEKELERILAENPELAKKENLRIVYTLGGGHTSFVDKMRAEGITVVQTTAESMTDSYFSRVENKMKIGERPTSEELARRFLEKVVDNALSSGISQDELQDISSLTYCFHIAEAFKEHEIKAIYEAVKTNTFTTDDMNVLLADKNLGPLPTTLDELKQKAGQLKEKGNAAVADHADQKRNLPARPTADTPVTRDNPQHDMEAAKRRLQDTVEEAHDKGIDEELLGQMAQALGSNDRESNRKDVLRFFGRQTGLPPEDVQDLVSSYKKEQIRSHEQGPLYHYHQTSYEGFEGAAEEEALLSYNDLKEKGKAPKGSGWAPHVVLTTRDTYDQEGNVVKPGLFTAGGYTPDDVALVFDPSIMDAEGYDCFGMYPSLPRIGVNRLHAALVKTEEEIPRVQGILKNIGVNAPVMTREAWERRTYSKDQPETTAESAPPRFSRSNSS